MDMPASCMPRCCCKLSPEEEMMMKMGTMHEGYSFSAEEKADIQTLNEYFLYLSEKVDFFNRAKSVYLTASVKLAYQSYGIIMYIMQLQHTGSHHVNSRRPRYD